MNLQMFKEKMMPSNQQVEREAPTELDPTLLALVGGGSPENPPKPNFANAAWSKRF